MTEVNDFFVRTLRDSTRGRTSTTVVKSTARSSLGSSSAIVNHHTTAKPLKKPTPPDLLANLFPADQADTRSGSVKSSGRSAVRASVVLASKRILSSLNGKRETTPVKEYQPPVKPSTNDEGLQRRHSTAMIQQPALLESNVRVVPSWFPPAKISRLQRQASFHGETAASRYMKAKKQPVMSDLNPTRKFAGGKSSDGPVKSTGLSYANGTAVISEELTSIIGKQLQMKC